MQTIPFKFKFNMSSQYNHNEISNFIECADSVEPAELREAYRAFLEELLNDNIKPSTMVRLDIMRLFVDDIDNRAQIDYREGHWDDEPSIVRGGKFFDRRSKEMKSYLMMGA
jgi:hypothetical protein